MYNVNALTAPQRKLLAAIAHADATRFEDDGADYRLSGSDRRVVKRLAAAGWVFVSDETEQRWARSGVVDVDFQTATLSYIGDAIVGTAARVIVYTQGAATVTVWIADNGCSEDLVYRFQAPNVDTWGSLEGDTDDRASVEYLWSKGPNQLAAQVYSWLA